MKKPVIIVGLGEMGGVFARGFLRSGYPVYPVTRDMNIAEVSEQIAGPELVLIAVAEGDLQDVLIQIPEIWRDRIVLLQNELLPRDWQQHKLDPTVISVWFEKKKGQEAKVIIPSPVFGQHAQTVAAALASIDIATNVLVSADDLLFELVLKNVYILTTNIAGLVSGGTVGELWANNQTLANNLAAEIIELQEKMTGQNFEVDALITGMTNAFEGDPDHKCMGRSAPARLERALALAVEHELELPVMARVNAR